MLIPDINSIHEIAPPLFIGGVSNRTLPPEEMICFRCRGIRLDEKEGLDRQFALFATTHNPEERVKEKSRLDYDLARSKFVSLHNYFVPGPEGPRAVTEFDDFCRVAPSELVAWYFDVIQFGEKLSAAEQRNFLPPAASPSGSPSGEVAPNGRAETALERPAGSGTATT
jgi:hypothetical protein